MSTQIIDLGEAFRQSQAQERTPVRERPILYTGAMVRAILADMKTHTRRVIKPDWWGCLDPDSEDDREKALGMCPFGVPGDRLWVRETFCLESDQGVDSYEPPHNDGRPLKRVSDPDWGNYWVQPHYRATDKVDHMECVDPKTGESYPGVKWKPSIFMPRWASRITLEVADLRVERVQDISEADAKAEGVECASDLAWDSAVGQPDPYRWAVEHGHRAAFRELWDSINAKRGHGWDANDWVWVVEFKRLGAP